MARHDFIAVYLMASRRNGTLYLGVTSDLLARAAQHRSGAFKGFAAKYGCTRLVWFERGADMPTAIAREKELKRWRRGWKLALIEADNPQWLDLYEDFLVPRDGRRPELEDGSPSPGFRGRPKAEPGTQGTTHHLPRAP